MQGPDARHAIDDRPAAAASFSPAQLQQLWQRLQGWAAELGFSQIGVADIDLQQAEAGLLAWLDAGFHGEMGYMAAHGLRRARPAELLPGTVRVVSVAMPYLAPQPPVVPTQPFEPSEPSEPFTAAHRAPRATPGDPRPDAAAAAPVPARTTAADAWRPLAWQRLADAQAATVSLYAHGRDYHKVLRQRLQRLADRLQAEVGARGHRVFVDSAPVLEVELATRAGLGWRGKHTLLLNRQGGSMFFLGELFIDLPLPVGQPVDAHCGRCRACLDVCPTGAIVAPYRLDARRCISYLTIEHDGPIPERWRAAIGNRIYGCDDCQLICPWNRYARTSALPDFAPRAGLHQATLAQLWGWDEAAFLRLTEGSAIRRIGWRRWRRNLAVAMGNAWRSSGEPALAAALRTELDRCTDAMLSEHLAWALAQRG